MVHCLVQCGDINVHEIIAEGIQDSAEKNDPGARLCYPPAQQQRRPQIGKRTAQEEPHQEEPHQEELHQEKPQQTGYQQEGQYDPTNINLFHIQGAIEDLPRRYMEGQEQQLHVQSQRIDRQEELLSGWMDQQREWQKQQMELQQEHYSQLTQAINQVTERQESQDKHLQELNQRQIA
ncbi:uncharacterized protein LOC107474263 [Arachis duranensis]|uniref:Uncharacterized protein LOC107474263 n=1 Tax=Arachis duranensis TaxID=130453 RepID=A0A6P4CDM4_ARADU|nr:uncharacterized protein LOC107474263 [Arachis duranensis]